MGRAELEGHFGRIGAGARRLAVAGTACTLPELMARLGLAFVGCRTIDRFQLGPDHFALRYYDPDEQPIVAYDFDGEFRYLGEMRVHVAEWVEDDALQEDPPGWTWS